MGQVEAPADTSPMLTGLILTAAEALLALGIATGVLLVRP
jgi:hypothetical protein